MRVAQVKKSATYRERVTFGALTLFEHQALLVPDFRALIVLGELRVVAEIGEHIAAQRILRIASLHDVERALQMLQPGGLVVGAAVVGRSRALKLQFGAQHRAVIAECVQSGLCSVKPLHRVGVPATIDKCARQLDVRLGPLDTRLAAGAKPQLLIYVAAKDVPQLHGSADKPNPIVCSIDTAWISLSEKDDMVTLQAELQGTSADKAAKLQQSILGVKAFIGLSAGNDNPDPVVTAVDAADKSFTATLKDKTVIVSWPVPVEQATTIFTAIADKRK